MISHGTAEWFEARLGKVTASRVGDLTRKRDGSWGADAMKYLYDLLAERLTGGVTEHYQSPAMQWGVETERDALLALAKHLGHSIEPVGFRQHPTIPKSGATPDGRVRSGEREGWLVEVKCPQTATHLRYLSAQNSAPEAKKLTPLTNLPDNYIDQCAYELACCPEAPGIVFASFDPRIQAEALRLCVVPVAREDFLVAMADAEARVRSFLSELDALEAKITAGVPAGEAW